MAMTGMAPDSVFWAKMLLSAKKSVVDDDMSAGMMILMVMVILQIPGNFKVCKKDSD